jgi:hypothetical protein
MWQLNLPLGRRYCHSGDTSALIRSPEALPELEHSVQTNEVAERCFLSPIESAKCCRSSPGTGTLALSHFFAVFVLSYRAGTLSY